MFLKFLCRLHLVLDANKLLVHLILQISGKIMCHNSTLNISSLYSLLVLMGWTWLSHWTGTICLPSLNRLVFVTAVYRVSAVKFYECYTHKTGVKYPETNHCSDSHYITDNQPNYLFQVVWREQSTCCSTKPQQTQQGTALTWITCVSNWSPYLASGNDVG